MLGVLRTSAGPSLDDGSTAPTIEGEAIEFPESVGDGVGWLLAVSPFEIFVFLRVDFGIAVVGCVVPSSLERWASLEFCNAGSIGEISG